MKTVAIFVLVLVGLFAWKFGVRGDGLVLVAPDSGKRISAAVARVDPDARIVVAVDNPGKEQAIVEISVDRAIAARLQLDAPAGFAAEPLPLSADEAKDPDTVAFVESYNAENIRWVGRHPVTAGSMSEIAFPAGRTTPLGGVLQFVHEGRWGMGKSTSAFQVTLEP